MFDLDNFGVVEDTPQKVSSRWENTEDTSIIRSKKRKTMKAKKLEFHDPVKAKKMEFDDLVKFDDPTGLLQIFLPRFFS